MADKILGNNQVNIYGEVVSDFTFSHEVYGEGFYMVYLSVKRLSQVFDTIPLMISERLIDITKDYRGMYMEASGQFRSYNRHEENHNRLVLSVFVRDVRVDELENEVEKPNYIFLDGYLCKPPVYRKTPLGRIQSREYQKQVGDEEYETRIAYEISVSKLERVEESGEVIAASEISEEDGEETLDL